MVRIAVIVLTMVAIAGCSSGAAEDAARQASERAQQAEASLSAAQADTDAKQSQLDETAEELADAEARVVELEGTATEAQAEAQRLQAEVDALRLEYDPQIRNAINQLNDRAITAACTQGRTDAKKGRANADPVTSIDVDVPAGLQGQEFADLIDTAAVTTEYTKCFREEKAALEEKRDRAQLTKDRGDGFFTVGDEIAPGTWRSTGGGDSCYWERLSGLSGEFEDIIANHFGTAGVTVTIATSDKAFKAEGCGTWKYLG